MITLAQGQAVSPTSPALVFIAQNVGQIVPCTSVSYRILDVSSPEKAAAPVQVFPDSGLQAVDLVNDAVQNDPLGQVGVFAARWTVPSDASVGRYLIEWTYQMTSPLNDGTYTITTDQPSPAGTFQKAFEVVKAAGIAWQMGALESYALICDVREALGWTRESVSDVRLGHLIAMASRWIERITQRTFAPRYKIARHGGNSSRKLLLGEPIIAISSVGIDTEPTQQGDLCVELDLLRVYNRHLSEGTIAPDDRENPKLEFVHSDDLYGIRFIPFRGISLRSLAWPVGVQNIHVRGFFGYTDPDGSPWGETPRLIQHVVSLIVARELPKIGTDAREDAQWRWRINDQKSGETEIKMVDPRKWGEFFGDPEIDSILTSFVRPPALAST